MTKYNKTVPTFNLSFLPEREVSSRNVSSPPLSLRISWDFLRMSRAAMHDCLCCTREKDFLNSFPQVGTQAYICGIRIKVKRRMNKTRLPLRKVAGNCMGLDGAGGDLGPIVYLRSPRVQFKVEPLHGVEVG